MKLSAKALVNVDGLNAYKITNQVEANENQANDLYFQLIDLHRDGLRYIPAAGSVLKVNFDSIDDSKKLEITASNPFADDRSIFKVSLASSQLPSSGGILFTLNENSADKSFYVPQIIIVNMLAVGGC